MSQQAARSQMILGEMLPRLFRVAFLLNRRYYPWRRCFWRMLRELPVGPAELLGEFETIGSQEDWQARSAAVHGVVRILTGLVLQSGLLTADMLTSLFAARSERAWENPDWLEVVRARSEKASAAGYDVLDGWIWNRWGWQ